MSHPETPELFEFIDSRLDKERAGEVEAHLAVCALCRRRAELERSMRHIVRYEPLAKAPAGLSALIMVDLAAPMRDSLVLRLLSKLGSFVAMIVVLAVVGIIIVQFSNENEDSGRTSSSITQIVVPLSDMYTKGVQTFVYRTSAITQAIETKADVQFWKTVFVVLLTIGVLAGADRMFGKRFMKVRP
jgi:hypothetical protein